MIARVPSAEPTFANEAERLVWETPRDQLPADAIVISGLRIVDETLDHRADIIALLPGAGVVVVEVKGGSVWFGARDRDAETDEPSWWQQGNGQRPIDPVTRPCASSTPSASTSRPTLGGTASESYGRTQW